MKKVEVISDVQLLAAIVTRLLKQEHHVDEAPALANYVVQAYPERFNGSSDVRVAVKLARNVEFDVSHQWPADDERDMGAITEAATEIADNVAALYDLRGEILQMCAEVRAATRREIAKAKRAGLDYRLVSAQPFALWDSVRDGFAVKVIYERLSEYLRMEPVAFDASYAQDVADGFGQSLEEQERRTITRRNLDSIGATGRIDSVLINALREAGHNVPHILQRLAAEDSWLLDVGKRSGDRRTFTRGEHDPRAFTLHWKNGTVYGQVVVDDNASWHEEKLSFKKVPMSLKGIEGKRLANVIANDKFGDIRVRSAAGKKGEWGWLNCEGDLLYFDAETGRLWAA